MTTNNELRELAEKATPGPWTTDCGVIVIAAGSDQLNNGYGICECHGPESRQNVDFIAAASPAAILALLDDIEALQAECEKLRKDAETERQLQRAAKCLPEGWRIVVEVEKDSGWADVYDPDYRRIAIDVDGSLSEQIEQAIDAAMQGGKL